VKPSPFDYAAPATLEEALGMLDDESRPLAGGQSLIPLLNFRLARPARLVDLGRLDELSGVRASNGELRIGAMTRQATVEHDETIAARWPLLAQAVRHVGHPQIRNRGTVGGSVAHADPAAELPVALTALDARFHVRSARGERTLAAGELFAGPLTTTLEPDELLVEVAVPALPEGARTAFVEYARTHGDFALAGAAAIVAPGTAAIALLGAGPTPLRATEAERALADSAEPIEVGRIAAAPVEDDHRRALISDLVRRAVTA
jgi:CO/xanthine dehydrogenase FAD-binding subunit